MDEPSRKRIDLFGVPLDLLSFEDTKDALDGWLGGAAVCVHVVTLNPEYVMQARAMPEFGDAIRRAQLIVADGAGVAAAARLLSDRGMRPADRLTGVDLGQHLARRCRERGQSIFLLGGSEEAAAGAARTLSEGQPAVVAGWWSGGTATEDTETIERIAMSGASVLLVAYGASGQVMWIDRNRKELAAAGIRVAVGVGGAFDYWSGLVPRAPRVVRRFGFEWLYRLLRQPWRWRRQLALPRFTLLVARAWIARFRAGRREGVLARSTDAVSFPPEH